MIDPGLLADVVVAIHFAYVLFALGGECLILLGGLLDWGWVRNTVFRILHLAAVLLVAAQYLLGKLCPLTALENSLRSAAGQHVDREITFVGRLIRSIIFYDFPPWVFGLIYLGFGALVVTTFILIPPRGRGR
ncbi:MAG: DUF2784 domain-containing protein [Spirochaetaceae bacterium]